MSADEVRAVRRVLAGKRYRRAVVEILGHTLEFEDHGKGDPISLTIDGHTRSLLRSDVEALHQFFVGLESMR